MPAKRNRDEEDAGAEVELLDNLPSQRSSRGSKSPAKKKKVEDKVVEIIDDSPAAVEKKKKEASSPPKKPVNNILATLGKKPAPPAAAATTTTSSGKEIQAGGLADGIEDDKWKEMLKDYLTGPKFGATEKFYNAQVSAGKQVFPPKNQIFSAFNYTHFDNIKVVLIGQDPYHDDNQAHGLCFSVLPGIKPPPSLKNMYTELEQDILGFKAPNHGYLSTWAKQGVLMLNATLTVEAHKANSHSKESGWMDFTDHVIKTISAKGEPCVFLLWGGFAQKKKKLIDSKKHKVIEVAHPSPLSVTKWRGCKTFSKCNAALSELGKEQIDWTLPAVAKVE